MTIRFLINTSTLVLLGVLAQLAQSCELSIGWEHWPPYQFENRPNDPSGMDIQITEAVLARMDCDATFIHTPWKRHLRELEFGRIDIAAGADFSAERAEYAYFSEPYRVEDIKLFILKEDIHKAPPTLEDVSGREFRLGITLGYAYGAYFRHLQQTDDQFRNQLETAPSIAQNLQKLIRGDRIDGFLADPLVVEHLAKNTPYYESIKALPIGIEPATIHFMFSRAKFPEELVHSFNNTLAEFVESSEYIDIIDDYDADPLSTELSPIPAPF